MFVCVRETLRTRARVCVSLCACVCVWETHTQIDRQIETVYMFLCVYVCVCERDFACVCVCVCMCQTVRAYVCACVCACWLYYDTWPCDRDIIETTTKHKLGKDLDDGSRQTCMESRERESNILDAGEGKCHNRMGKYMGKDNKETISGRGEVRELIVEVKRNMWRWDENENWKKEATTLTWLSPIYLEHGGRTSEPSGGYEGNILNTCHGLTHVSVGCLRHSGSGENSPSYEVPLSSVDCTTAPSSSAGLRHVKENVYASVLNLICNEH